MAGWTDIPDASVDQDSPITEELMTALRDNPEALAERDAGAPHLNTTPLVDVITVSGTFTVPTGVTRIKATVTGGGGPGTGGTSSLDRSGTDLVRATGGGAYSAPGAGTDGDLQVTGGDGARASTAFGSVNNNSGVPGGSGGASYWGGGGAGGQAHNGSTNFPGQDAHAYGAGGGGQGGGATSPGAASGGAAGGTAIGWIAVTPGESLTVTIGAGGTSSGYGDGADGVVVIEY